MTELRDFMALSYGELEELNLKAKEQRSKRVPADKIQEERLKYLTDEKRIKAVTVLFSDLEGRLHMLDYDKKFLVKSWDNLTFDGSSIRGFTAQRESDLRLAMDWSAFYWVPADFFGAGKVLVFGEIIDKDGTPYGADIRGVLKGYAAKLYKENGYTLNAANEIEGFLFKGADAERHYPRDRQVRVRQHGRILPLAARRPAAHVHRHARRKCSAPWASRTRRTTRKWRRRNLRSTTATAEVVAAADQIQLYKLICRQVATSMGFTASFPAEAGGGRERQRHAHQRFDQQGRQESVLGSEGRGEDQQAGVVVRGPDPDAMATTSAWC